MNLKQIYGYYSRPDIQEFFMRFSKNREVVGVFDNGSYSARPNTLFYPRDVLAMVKEGSLEFHCSIERWSQPMRLKSDNYDSLRIGWDIVFDLDCEVFEHGKIAAKVLSWALEKHGIKGYWLKFTGGTGFHIGIPWESLPKSIDYKPALGMFPELPRNIGYYLKDYVREKLERELLKTYGLEKLAEQVNKNLGEITVNGELDPFKIVDLDTILISPRHLFRMPYSLNKNTFLVSLPVKPGELDAFTREVADPLKHEIKVRGGLLNPTENYEAETLIGQAIDWVIRRRRIEKKKAAYREGITEAVPKELFPPCIKNILEGLPDGKKRSVFILCNFLRSVKWGWPEIEKEISAWNQKNRPSLKDNYVRGQLRWHRMQKGDILLPPGCQNAGWYESFGVCTPDYFCGGPAKTIKNPVNYSLGKTRRTAKAETKQKGRKPRDPLKNPFPNYFLSEEVHYRKKGRDPFF